MQAQLGQSCLLCGADVPNTNGPAAPLCPGCLADLPRLATPRCPVCALPTALGEVCGGCLRHPPAFDATHAAYRYAYPLDALLQHYKYGQGLHLAGFLAEQLAAEIATGLDTRPDLVIPMPLHPRRLQERGYNQAGEIAKRLARRLDLPVALTACTRAKDAPPQASLPLKERRKNIRGAFECRMDLAGKRIALVDDVMTSGASLDELAKTVKKAGAVEVRAWVVARTLPMR
ncbi:MAG: ComF family protein [Pseudomonadota bacterium]